MPFPETLTLDPATDFHVHLRDGPLCRAVTPTIRNGGVDTVYVMVCCFFTSHQSGEREEYEGPKRGKPLTDLATVSA